jgi:hypothetical protein
MAMSPERRKELSEKMKARWAAKKSQEQQIAPEAQEEPVVQPEFKEIKETVSMDDYNALKRQIEELKGMFQAPQVQLPQAPQFSHTGKLLGRVDKYIIDPANYPNPCERLSKEPRLQRFAFPINYELDFQVTSTQYQNQEGVNMREPKFTLELHKIVMDEDTGEPTNGRYVVCRAIFHEDPQAALVIARDNGLEVNDSNEKTFLDEMRYLRMRDWLLEAFYPKAAQPARQRKEVVVGNKLVEFFTVNSESSQSPFKDINSSTKKL